jgi:hypothetical protein
VIEIELPQAIIDAVAEQAKKHGFTPTAIKVEVTSSTCPPTAKR